MTESFSDRQKNYEDAYDYKMTKRLPVIIRCDGKKFHKVTKKLRKPFCHNMSDLMAKTMLHTVVEVEGAIFAYQQSDEITIVVRNDKTFETEPWFQNRIQKIASITASMTTLSFMKNISMMENPPEIVGDALFDCRVFAVPSLSEAANNLVLRQQDCYRNSINNAAQSELSKVYGKSKAIDMLHGKKVSDKIKILSSECEIDYEDYYPGSFKRGTAIYKVPKIINTGNGEVARNKWKLDLNIPDFITDRNFILNILHSGHDVFRND